MVSAIIVAAGTGKRMGLDTPKQFITIGGHSILWHTLHGFVSSQLFEEIIIVLSKDYFPEGEALKKHFPEQKIVLCQGGNERFHSVQNALQMVNENCTEVFIHDAVRPFFSKKLLEKCLSTCRNEGSAIPSTFLKDSIRKISGNESIAQPRDIFRSIQTPQVFNFAKLKSAYQQEHQANFTDDASVFEQAGYVIHLVEGEEENIKITTPVDLEWATFKLK